jgi:DNA-binding transcriptional MerR regulator
VVTASSKIKRGAASSRRSKSEAGKDETYHLTIGDLAREFNVTLRTLRFYEDRGLIKPRRSGLTRLYSDASRERLKQILRGTTLGFTLTELRAMLGADGSPKAVNELKLSKTQITEQLTHLERQKVEVEKAIAELKAMQRSAA